MDDLGTFIARQADSHESLEFPIRANHPIRGNHANRFARVTPLRAARVHLLIIDFMTLKTRVSRSVTRCGEFPEVSHCGRVSA